MPEGIDLDDLPEPLVPLRNMGEILDKEIPIRVRKELRTVGVGILLKSFKAFLYVFPIMSSGIIIYYR